jgi:ribosomal protein L35
MTSSPLAKIVGALRGTRAMHASATSLVGPAKGSISSGTLSDRSRLTARTPLGGVSSGSRGLWTGGARDAALDAGRGLIASPGVSWAVLASRAAKPGALAAQTRGVKTKIKPYSSWKRRFQVTASGLFKRKQKGKRHKAFSKSPAQRMRLRGDRLVHESLVKPMKKLGFKLR